MSAPLLVRAARREPVERTPVWFMRQAGRSLPEYRKLRERHGLFDIGRNPELCADVTLQPVRRHGVDAAVMFADIMTPVISMGVDVELVESIGPFTVAGYLVEGKPTREFVKVKQLMYNEPGRWHALLGKLAEGFAQYVSEQ